MSASGKTSRREQALAALLAEPTIALAAQKAGIGEATLTRWLKEPGFVAEYRRARRSVVEAAIGSLQQAAAEVRHILLELAADNLGEPLESLRVADGTITGNSSTTTYWKLVTGRELEGLRPDGRGADGKHGAAQ